MVGTFSESHFGGSIMLFLARAAALTTSSDQQLYKSVLVQTQGTAWDFVFLA
jgi:hypothetical protein